jgi:RNA-directed DNA polymerase
VQRFRIRAAAIAMEEGSRVHRRKTRVMRQSVRQHLAGVVLNEKRYVRRSDYDALKAILHNCARHGPASQNWGGHSNFRAHLLGRIEHMSTLHPLRGARLRHAFNSIRW